MIFKSLSINTMIISSFADILVPIEQAMICLLLFPSLERLYSAILLSPSFRFELEIAYHNTISYLHTVYHSQYLTINSIFKRVSVSLLLC